MIETVSEEHSNIFEKVACDLSGGARHILEHSISMVLNAALRNLDSSVISMAISGSLKLDPLDRVDVSKLTQEQSFELVVQIASMLACRTVIEMAHREIENTIESQTRGFN